MKTQFKRTPSNKRSGFTLVELLVVVAVIAALASIAIPNYVAAIKRAQSLKQATVISAIEKAKDRISIDALKNTGDLPVGFNVKTNDQKFGVLNPYLSQGAIAAWSITTYSKGTGKPAFTIGDIVEGGTSTSLRTSASF